MGFSPQIYNGQSLIDLSGDNVTADDLPVGVVAHDASGRIVSGTKVYRKVHYVSKGIENVLPGDLILVDQDYTMNASLLHCDIYVNNHKTLVINQEQYIIEIGTLTLGATSKCTINGYAIIKQLVVIMDSPFIGLNTTVFNLSTLMQWCPVRCEALLGSIHAHNVKRKPVVEADYIAATIASRAIDYTMFKCHVNGCLYSSQGVFELTPESATEVASDERE